VLTPVCALVSAGGFAVIGVNAEAFEGQAYAAALAGLTASRGGELLAVGDMPYWPEKDVGSRVVVLRF
jgi:hypothetical protein